MWSIDTNGAVLVMRPTHVMTDTSEVNLGRMILPIPHPNATFTDVVTDASGDRVGVLSKKGVESESFRMMMGDMKSLIGPWRSLPNDKMLKPVIERVVNPTDDRGIMLVTLDAKFLREIASAVEGDKFWLAVPIARAEEGVFIADGRPVIGGDDGDSCFALCPPTQQRYLNDTTGWISPGDKCLEAVLPMIHEKARQILGIFTHLASLIGGKVETKWPHDE